MTTNKLTQEEKRIKIAEACGKEPVCVCPIHGAISGRATPEKMLVTNCPWCGNDLHWEDFPDCFNDLNACQSAWETLTAIQHEQFKWHLVRVVRETREATGKKHSVTCAPANLRAEALGRTLEAWEAGQ
jgi:hypothetical protein